MHTDKQPKKLIRRVDEAILAKAIIDEQSITTKPLSLPIVLQRLEHGGTHIDHAFKTMAYRFLERLRNLQLIDPYYDAALNEEWRYKIFWLKPNGIQILNEELHDFRSKI